MAHAKKEVHPCDTCTRECRGTAGDPEPEPSPRGGVKVAVRRSQRPRDSADQHHEHRNDEHERQQGADDALQL